MLQSQTLQKNGIIFLSILFVVNYYQSNFKPKTGNEQAKQAIAVNCNFNAHSDSFPSSKKTLDLQSFYDDYNLDGTFVSYDKNKNEYNIYNDVLLNSPATPASTFNIVTSLIALEEGICKDENGQVKWDEFISTDTLVHREATLQFAFQNNIDHAFWKLRKMIGKERMNYWLQKLKYGNLILPNKVGSSDGKDDFWVVSREIRITPLQQLEFMMKVFYNELPFSKKSVAIVKELMYQKNIKGYSVYGKRGSYRLTGENKYIGWFIGYAENSSDILFFVNYLQTSNLSHPKIVEAQKNIAYNILNKLALLK